MAATNVFIDTNVFLSFFAYTKDDIDQLSKLSDLIKSGELNLYVSSQVEVEFYRNRETKLAESIGKFSSKSTPGVPRFIVDTDEAEAYRKALAAFDKAHNDLMQKANLDASSASFAVDTVVPAIFADAKVGNVSPEQIERAKMRRDIGNPPGKDKSLGDQINWEYLLDTVPDGVTLHVVSKDGDYQSAFKNGKPHQFLANEWRDKKKGTLCLHQEIKPFLNDHFATMQLQIDKEKQEAVSFLVSSGSFSTTHGAIDRIEPFFDALNVDDAHKILEAGVDNNQIRWISTDSDVRSFFVRLLETFKGQLDFGTEANAEAIFKPKTTDEFADYEELLG